MLQNDDNDWVNKCMEYEVDCTRARGRPKRTRIKVVQKVCQARKLNKEEKMEEIDKGWLVIRIGVDQDRCEWVNVSYGTGSPGLSRKRAVKRL